MSTALQQTPPVLLDLTSGRSGSARRRLALADLANGLTTWRLSCVLGWLDIRVRYRGSLLGPFWLTLSTGIMVAALGFLYSQLFHMDLNEYLPFLALSLVLWNAIGGLVADACGSFTQYEGMIRSVRMPFTLYAARTVIRNAIVLAHNIPVILVVWAVFDVWPGWHGLLALPGILLWTIDGLACCLLLGAICARFRDIPPIVASVMQIAFFVSPIIWKPELVGANARYLPLNPFYVLTEVVRAPLLGASPGMLVLACAGLYSAALCLVTWVLFVRVRSRIAFWI
ncbi:MAG: ABC transporter permease [Acetobacteraceae bacterium]|nr:ABC transporter permease [Acetobacteraceae bacterium]